MLSIIEYLTLLKELILIIALMQTWAHWKELFITLNFIFILVNQSYHIHAMQHSLTYCETGYRSFICTRTLFVCKLASVLKSYK